MFWRNIYTPSRVDTLLENENVTLQELMDEDDIVQECKSSNKKLIDFLARSEIVEMLLKMVLDEPCGEVDDKMRFRYSNIACELISSDVSQITEILVATEPLVLSLFAFLGKAGPLNSLQASFFSKIMGLLISRKSEMMFELIKSQDEFIEKVLHHLGTSAIMDLLLRLITCIDAAECRSKCINWLNEKKLVQQLILLIDSSETPERNTNAAQTLCDIIRLGKDTLSSFQEGPSLDALLLEVEKSESVASLLDQMFKGDSNESAIVNGLYVLQALMEPRRTSDLIQEPSASSDVEHLSAIVSGLSDVLVLHLKDFHDLLINPPKQHYTPMPTSLGPVSLPLGFTRLHVISLVSSLIAANDSIINAKLASLCTVGCVLDLFFRYPWNNFLHTQVEQCITTIVNSKLRENPLLSQLIKDYNLLERIVQTFSENEDKRNLPGKQHLGHLGHLTRIANLIASKISMGRDGHMLACIVEELPEEAQKQWQAFVGGLLAEVNRVNALELGGTSSGNTQIPSSSEDDDDLGYLNFHMDDNLQKAFADYQLQQMTNNFVEQFGYSEEEFAEQEESIGSPFMSKIASIDFELNMIEDNPTAAALFEQACNDRIRQFDNTDSDDEWDLKEMSSFSHISENQHCSAIPAGNNTRFSSKHDVYEDEEDIAGEETESDNSSDSEDDLSSPRLIRQTYEGNEMKAEEATRLKFPSESSDFSSLCKTADNISNPIDATFSESSEPQLTTSTVIQPLKHNEHLLLHNAPEVSDGVSINDICINVNNDLSMNKGEDMDSRSVSLTETHKEKHGEQLNDGIHWCLNDSSGNTEEFSSMSVTDPPQEAHLDVEVITSKITAS